MAAPPKPSELTNVQRRAVVDVAQRLVGIPYDHDHDGESWRDLRKRPAALDCSSFVCRVACEALQIPASALAPSAEWLLDSLPIAESPLPGDVVGYWRAALRAERVHGRSIVWHVMIYAGNGGVIGACNIAGTVTKRAIEYEPQLGPARWRLIDHEIEPAQPFRSLRIPVRQ